MLESYGCFRKRKLRIKKTIKNKTNLNLFHKFKFLEQKLPLTLEASLPILHVPQEQLLFAEQKLHFDEIDTAHFFTNLSAISKPLMPPLLLGETIRAQLTGSY